jgi:ketosteroid isomerase-like protein
MSNAAFMTSAYARYNQRDWSFIDDYMSPTIQWHLPGPQDDLQGSAAVLEFFQGIAEQFNAHRIDVVNSLEVGDQLWCHVRHTFTSHDGAAHEIEAVHMWTMNNGKVTRLIEVADTLGFAVAAGMIPAEALQGG